jgi:HlyD family secretion protein
VVRRSQLQAMERQQAAAGAQTSKAQVRLDYTEIHAPIPGVISVLAARQGEVVNIGQPIVSIINPDDLWVRADMPETFLDRVRLGDSMPVRFPDGRESKGTVFYRGVDADYATQRDVSQSKRDIKTFELRLRVDNSDRRLWPGLTTFITIPAQDGR